VNPALPVWLPEIVLYDIRLADAIATIRFWRDGEGRSHAEPLKSRGTFHLLHQPPPESLSAGFGDRLRAIFDTVRH